MLCKKLHHAAYRCKDAVETTRFYTEVLGLKFAHAMGEDHVPSTGKYSPHVHIFFEMEDGSSIAFFECPNDPGNMKDLSSPDNPFRRRPRCCARNSITPPTAAATRPKPWPSTPRCWD